MNKQPDEKHLGISFRLGVSPDEKSMVFEYVTSEGKLIGVAFHASVLNGLRKQVSEMLQKHPKIVSAKAPSARQ